MDAYPKFGDIQALWLVAILENIAKAPEDIGNVARHRDGLDLQISFTVAKGSRHRFTEERCRALQVLLSEVTGVASPIVYVEGDPHPQAQEALRYAQNRL